MKGSIFIFNQQGLTFIEVIVAMGVLLTAIISGLTLAAFNMNSSISSENRLIASNLGRESIEVLRSIRDSNWLSGQTWNEGMIQNDINYRLIVKFDPTANLWATQDITEPISSCADCVLYYHPANGSYNHTQSPDGVATTFKRLVTKNEICWQPAVAAETVLTGGNLCSASGLELIGWQLISELTWRDNNKDHNMQIVDRMYDWK